VDRPSLFADAIGAIKLAVDLHAPHHPCKVIGFTSSVPREGKSTIATAFAQLSTHLGGRGILVDLDLRHRWLTQSLTPRAERGLLSVVNGQASLDDVVWTDPSLGMAFLPCVGPGLSNACHLLAGDNMKGFFDGLRTKYDYIIVDLPPLLPVADVRATTKLIDHYVFVVEWGQTRMDISQRCLTDVPGVQEKLLGVVLNKVEFKSLGRYDISGASYYSKRYFRPSMWP
jgi:succinoglycan biosynthesis transport protein ExoP